MYDRIATAYTLSNWPLLVSTGVQNFGGFVGYGLAVRQLLTRGTSPAPLWVHTFFLVHDSTWAIRCLLAAPQYDYHWFLIIYGLGLFVWTAQEIYTIYRFITDDAVRQNTWGPYRQGPVSKRDATWSSLKQIVGFYCIFNFVASRFAPDGAPMYDWFILSIVADTWGPVQLWRTRKWREDCGPARAVVMVVNAIVAFQPWNMWVTAFPDLYDTFWFKALGVVNIAISIVHLKIVMDMPSEPKRNKGKVQ